MSLKRGPTFLPQLGTGKQLQVQETKSRGRDVPKCLVCLQSDDCLHEEEEQAGENIRRMAGGTRDIGQP